RKSREIMGHQRTESYSFGRGRPLYRLGQWDALLAGDLTAARAGPRSRAADECDELAPLDHSITSSARASTEAGRSRPSALGGLEVNSTRSGVLLGWLAFEVGGIGKGVRAAIHPHHAGLFRSLRAPGVRRQRWNDDGVVGTNDTAFFAELHPDPAFKHDDGFFHFVHMERHCSARLGPVHEQANPVCAEVLVREKPSVDTGPHQDFRNRAPVDERHECPPLLCMYEAEN